MSADHQPILQPMTYASTGDDYSPWDLLPAPLPSESIYYTRYFYENVAKHFIKDFVRIMNNGLGIDLYRVMELEEELDNQIANVHRNLADNPLIQRFQKEQYKTKTHNYILEQKGKMKSKEHFIKPFSYKNMTHRSYFMYIYANKHGISFPEETLPGTNIPKWPVKLVKKLADSRPILNKLLHGNLTDTNPIVKEALNKLAQDKADMYNQKYLQKIDNPDLELDSFNPSSPKQKQELFEFLGIESESTSSTTGLPSWDRDEIERVNKETLDEDVRHLTQMFIDFSFAAIVRNNFIEAFYKYSVDGRLHGNLKLFGAKSFRPTSNKPNLLNMPSTKSIFAKPIKRCLTASEGRVVLGIDYSALEDRVIANISKDKNKLSVFLENIDGHCLAATYYFSSRVVGLIGNFSDNKEAAKALKKLVDEGNKEAISVRQDSKPISFGLAYGAFPPKVAATIKCPLDEAIIIFDAYHYELYPDVTAYRENYVLPTAKEEGQIHLGLGCTLISDNPDRDIRTISNATIQFWSILALLTINKMHQLIDKAGLQDRVLITSTIYDALYLEADADPKVIKWVNDNIVPVMEAQYLVGEIVHNEASLEVGLDWASLQELSKDATLEKITDILNNLEYK
jgi:hypothetical protein